MHLSQGRARGRLERLQAVRWEGRPLLWHGQSESGLEFFSPLPLVAPVRGDHARGENVPSRISRLEHCVNAGSWAGNQPHQTFRLIDPSGELNGFQWG